MAHDDKKTILIALIAISVLGILFMPDGPPQGGAGLAAYSPEPVQRTERTTAPSPTIALKLTPTGDIQEQLIGRSARGLAPTEANALEAIAHGERILREFEANNLKTSYIRDQLEAARSDFHGQNVTLLVQQIFNITSLRAQAQFIRALNTTFTPEEIEQITRHAKKIRYDYGKSIEHIERIEERRNLTFTILDQVAALDARIDELNTSQYNFTPVFNDRKVIKDKFGNEQLEEIPPIVKDANEKIDQIQVEATRRRTFFKASQQNIASFIKRNTREILITLVLLAFFGWIAYNETLIILLRGKVEDLITDAEILDKLIVKAQEDYLHEQKISKALYGIKLEKYNEKKLRISEQLPVIRANLRKREKLRFYGAILKPFKKLAR